MGYFRIELDGKVSMGPKFLKDATPTQRMLDDIETEIEIESQLAE